MLTRAADHSFSRAMSSRGNSSNNLSSLHSSKSNFDHNEVPWAQKPKDTPRDRIYSEACSVIDDLFNSSCSGDDFSGAGIPLQLECFRVGTTKSAILPRKYTSTFHG